MLIVTGSIAYDYIMGFPGSFSDHVLPEHNNNINLSFIVSSFAKRRGGTAGNVSYTLGLLEVQHKLFSYAGSDFTMYAKAFEELSIDLSGVKVDPGDYTSTGFAMADKDQNQIWGFYYGAGSKNKDLKLDTIASKDDLVLVGPQGAEGSLSFVKQCIELGIPYMFDPGFILTQVNDTDLEHGLTHAKYIIGNDYEINLMKKRISTWDTIIKDKVIITTLGENGALIAENDKHYQIKPVITQNLIATPGAGDAWRGGFLAGIARGFDLQTSGQMGSVASAYAVEHVGTQEHAFSKQAFAQRYKDAYNIDLTI